jgi:hypothetical protein
MAINKNHEFEELDGVKCGIVEKNVSPARLAFLKSLLEFNGYTVIAAPSPAPETYTVGVTDYTFNPTNAIFGRLLKTPDGHIVTLAYWQQRESVSQDEIPYYERG